MIKTVFFFLLFFFLGGGGNSTLMNRVHQFHPLKVQVTVRQQILDTLAF